MLRQYHTLWYYTMTGADRHRQKDCNEPISFSSFLIHAFDSDT